MQEILNNYLYSITFINNYYGGVKLCKMYLNKIKIWYNRIKSEG